MKPKLFRNITSLILDGILGRRVEKKEPFSTSVEENFWVLRNIVHICCVRQYQAPVNVELLTQNGVPPYRGME